MQRKGAGVERPVIFLDDGGVMNDNQRRGPQWQRHVADFLAPRLGGRKRDWRRANAAVAARLFRQMSLPPAGGPDDDFRTAPEPYLEAWLVGMCQEVDRQPPDGAVQRLALAREASAYVTRHVHAAIPGAIPAIRALWRQGYTLHTASSEFAADLDGYLRAMGVRDCFGTLYGCDVLGVAKAGPGYYERLFEHARVDPASALVVDDMEQALDWAAAAGARTVLCSPVAPFGCRHGHVVSLAALPSWLRNAARDQGGWPVGRVSSTAGAVARALPTVGRPDH